MAFLDFMKKSKPVNSGAASGNAAKNQQDSFSSSGFGLPPGMDMPPSGPKNFGSKGFPDFPPLDAKGGKSNIPDFPDFPSFNFDEHGLPPLPELPGFEPPRPKPAQQPMQKPLMQNPIPAMPASKKLEPHEDVPDFSFNMNDKLSQQKTMQMPLPRSASSSAPSFSMPDAPDDSDDKELPELPSMHDDDEQIMLPQRKSKSEDSSSQIAGAALRIMDTTQPIFIKLDDYAYVLESIDSMKGNAKECSDILTRCTELNKEQTTHLASWKSSVESAQKSFMHADSILFKKAAGGN